MELQKLLIADAAEEFSSALADMLKGTYTVRICQEGKETLRILDSFRPDILVLDMMLPGLDGISLLQRAAEAGLQPMVLATTRFASDYMMDAVTELGVGYVMVKPCDLHATVARIGDLTQRLKPREVTQPDPRTRVSNVLLSLGVPTKLRGFSCLREAILEAMRQPGQLVTKELYPTVARLCDGNAVQVERSIRSAIESGWKRRDEEVWRMYFRPNREGVLERPSNAAFITCIAGRLAMDRDL